MSDLANQNFGGANLEHARDHNQRVVLQAIRLNGPLSRADLADLTGLTLPSIANITKRLLTLDLITEETLRAGTRGQPAKRIAVHADGAAALGINIDRDHVSLAIIDLAGHVRAGMNENIHYPTPEAVAALVARELPHLLKDAGLARDKLVGAGVAMPDEFGSLELPKDAVSHFKDWAHVDIRALLQDKLDLPIFVENDATSAALGELQFGRGPRETDFFYTFIGVGLGGGLVLNGKPYRGATGRSGELGFMPTQSANPRETYLSDVVSLSVLRHRLKRAGHTRADDLETPTAEQKKICDIWVADAASHLGRAFVSIAFITNPSMFYLGGRLPRALLDQLCEQVNVDLKKYMRRAGLVPKVKVASRAEDAAVLGAAVLPIAALLLPVDASLLSETQS